MKVLVLGANGFLGKHLLKALYDAPFPKEIATPTSDQTDLRNAGETVALFEREKPEVVFNLAGTVGGIQYNRDRPADLWRDNVLIGVNVLDACHGFGVEKLVQVGTTCSYPASPKTIPFVEWELFDGMPEPSNAPYGIAKRSLYVGSVAYHKQYGLDVANVFPTNLYGPGDHFEPERSHVIPSMIRKLHEAREEKFLEVQFWGSGEATRDFLYVTDAARAIAEAAKLTSPEPVNVGSGIEIDMRELVWTINEVVGYKGRIAWDSSKPSGQRRRALDISRAKNVLGWEPKVNLYDGIKKTYEWFVNEVASKVNG